MEKSTTHSASQGRWNVGYESMCRAFINLFLVVVLTGSTITAAHAQNGKLKLKGEITNVDQSEQSLITLFRVDEGNTIVSVLGQFIVSGNDWFKTYLETDKRYMLEIASTNGLTRRYLVDMEVPEFAEDDRYNLEVSIDMKYSGEDWPVVTTGKIVYSRSSDAFAYLDWVPDGSVAQGLSKP